MKLRAQQRAGLTRWEVAALGVCGVVLLGLMALLILPSFTRPNRHGHRHETLCRNNLQQVGLTFRIWANDHEDRFPFASTNVDGSLAWVNSPEVFRHYQVMSNELVTPKILTCRADMARSPATNFADFSNANLSYFVGLDAREDAPNSILSGDRNINGGTLSNGFLRVLSADSAAEWTKEIHQNAGNIGLGDGSVQQVTAVQLRRQIASATTNRSFLRLAVP